MILAISSVMIIGASMAASASSDSEGYFNQTACTASTFTVNYSYTPASNSSYYKVINYITITDESGDVVYTKNYGTTSISDSYKFTGKSTGFTDKYKLNIYYTNYYYSGGSYTPTNPASYYYTYVNTTPKKIYTSNFGLSYISTSYATFSASRPANATGVQFKLYSVKSGNLLRTSTKYSYSGEMSASGNVAYKYRVRSYYDNTSNGERYYSSYSSYRYFCNIKSSAKVTYTTSTKGCKVKLKGISKVSSYKIYVTTDSSKKKGTLTRTVSPSKIGKYSTYTVNKIGDNYMKKGHTYYINIYPVIKDSSGTHVSDSYVHTSIYNYK